MADTTAGSTTMAATVARELAINNVVCSFSTRCHLNLRKIATHGINVEYKKENAVVNMRLRKPYTTATIWSSGKITCVGAKSEADAYKAARRYCRLLQKMQFKVKLCNYRVVNVLATGSIPFALDVARLAHEHQAECSYEPELHPGATYKLKELKTTLKLFTTGSITLTASSVHIARQAVELMYPILERFRHASQAAEQATTSSRMSSLYSNDVLAHTGVGVIKSEPSVVAAFAPVMPVVTATTAAPDTSSSAYFNPYHNVVGASGGGGLHSHHLNHNHLYQHTNDLLTSPSSFVDHDLQYYSNGVNGVSSSTGAGSSLHHHTLHHHHHLHHHHLQTNFYHQHTAPSHQLFASSSSSLPASSSSTSSSSQPTNWFYDNLIIEPVDDFLP